MRHHVAIEVFLVRYRLKNGKYVFWHESLGKDEADQIVCFLERRGYCPELISRSFLPSELLAMSVYRPERATG